ncbi:hypothetical protein BIZ92_32855 [Achromobacter xylosoxidans]|uniref:TonB-dependent siderophore receptor n=1 Tax=Alcaligenes xylosoxydans xylosoxydans TaxID=85698 RepID=A0A1R1JLL6_ALCXX|nr:hypothetical protein BIZ92_32855 [Achromobacter xylosoxidans]
MLFSRRVALACASALPALAMQAAHAQSASDAEVPRELPTVTVTGHSVETATGPVQGYVAKRTGTGTKTDTPILEVPQSISVVTRDEIAIQGTTNLTSALRYTSGMGPGGYESDEGNLYDAFTLRGFLVSDNALLQDGTRLNVNLLGGSSEPYGLERIEVLKGPSAGLYGNSGPSGVINLISKRPTADPLHEIGVTYGRYNRRQLTTDHSGALNDSGTLLYRLTALGRKSNTFVDYGKDDRVFIAPALTWKPSNQTRFTLLTHYQKNTATDYLGGSMGNNQFGNPRHRYLGEPDLNYYNTSSKSAGYVFEHRFNDMWKFTQSLRYSRSTMDFGYVFIDRWGGPSSDPSVIDRVPNLRHDEYSYLTADSNVQANWSAIDGVHTTLLGLDYGRSTSDRTGWDGTASSLNIYHPVYGLPIMVTTKPWRRDYAVQRQLGLYLQQQSTFAEHWVVTLGGRQDWIVYRKDDMIKPARSAEQSDHAFSGRAGLNYLFDNGVAPYISYATSFEPTVGTTWEGTPFKPTTGRQYEIGLKYQPPGTNALFTAALYDLRQQNVKTPDLVHPREKVQTGAIRARGLELEGKAEIAARTQIRGSVTFTNAEITKSNRPAEVGRKMADMPKQAMALWVDHRFMPNLTVGLGARYIGGLYSDSNKYKTASRTVFDAMASYRLDKWSLTLNVTNLFDKKYVSACNDDICWYGAPLNAMLTANYAW